MKNVFDVYNDLSQQAEEFIWKHFLPPFFKVMLFGMKITLAWAFYQTVKNVIDELF